MDNRARILQEALQLFSSRGYEAVGVQEIVQTAEVTKPTLYHYFGNKLGLLAEILDRFGGELLRKVTEVADYQGDLPLALNRLTNAYFEFASRQPEFYRFQLALLFAPPDSEPAKVARQQWERHYELLEVLFQQAAEDHGNMRGRSQAYAITLIGMINSYVAFSFQSKAELNQELAFRAVHQFMHGIYS